MDKIIGIRKALIVYKIFLFFYCISSDFSDLPDMTGEYIVLSEVYSTSKSLT